MCSQPFRTCRRRELVLLVVTQHDRRSRQRDLADVPLGQFASVLVDDAEAVPGERPAAAHEHRGRSTGPVVRGRGAPFGQVVCGHLLDPRTTPARRKRRSHDVLGEPVARKKAGLAEADRAELFGEGRQRRRVNRLAAAAGDSPAGQIQPLEIAILHPTHAQVIRKIGSEADRGAMARDGSQPFRRTLDERLRCQQHRGPTAIQGSQCHPDEPHIVVERQPAQGRIGGRGAEPGRPVDRVDVGREAPVGEHDALRDCRRSRGELHERDVVEQCRVIRLDAVARQAFPATARRRCWGSSRACRRTADARHWS